MSSKSSKIVPTLAQNWLKALPKWGLGAPPKVCFGSLSGVARQGFRSSRRERIQYSQFTKKSQKGSPKDLQNGVFGTIWGTLGHPMASLEATVSEVVFK